jgi:hypothetical protein
VAPDDVWVCVNGGVLEGPLAAPAVLFEQPVTVFLSSF